MATATIKNTVLVPDHWYCGSSKGWLTDKLQAVVYASPAIAEAVIVRFHMQAVTDSAGIVVVLTFSIDDTFEVPLGVLTLDSVVARGAAGGGAGGFGDAIIPEGGGGGGGGAFAKAINIPVTPLDVISVTVGVGGASGAGSVTVPTRGGNGTDSQLGDGSVVLAKGGEGGFTHADGANGGSGGNSFASVGTTVFQGGHGGGGFTSGIGVGGGGGACANSTSNGQDACMQHAGLSVDGGSGGNGGVAFDGSPGIIPGGGGGGAGAIIGTGANGGTGADGLVIVTYMQS
jgi:hypothetical protein